MNNLFSSSSDNLPLSEEEKDLLKKRKNDYLYLSIGNLVVICIAFIFFYNYNFELTKFEWMITVVCFGLLWIGLMFYFVKIYLDYVNDLQLNYKYQIAGIIEKMTWSIGENGGNTSIFIQGKKFSLPKEAQIDYSDLFDFIQQGDKAILYFAPQSKLLLGIKRIDENISDEDE